MAFVSILSREAWPVTTNVSAVPDLLCNASQLSAKHVLMRAGWMHSAQQLDSTATGTGTQLADTSTVVFGCIAFAAFVVLNSVERVPFLPVGRTGSSLVGALLMVIFGVIPADNVLAGLGSNLSLLALVWGSMVISHYLDKNGSLLRGLEAFCMWRPLGAWDSCMRLSLSTSFVAAFIGWDVGALMMSPVALKIVARYPGFSAKPFLSAVATGANAGSLLTPISNPGNVIVTLASGMSFCTFAAKMAGPWALAVFINAAVVVVSYGNHFFSRRTPKDCTSDTAPESTSSPSSSTSSRSTPVSVGGRADEATADQPQEDADAALSDADAMSRDAAQAASSPASSSQSQQPTAEASQEDSKTDPQEDSLLAMLNARFDSLLAMLIARFPQVAAWILVATQHWRGIFAYAVWVACLVFWFADVELGTVAICGGIALIMAEGEDMGEPIHKSAEWPVIAYIAGILIVIPAFDLTGVPSAVWDGLADAGLVSVEEAGGIVILVLVVVLFTNIVTNVPAVLMLGSRVAALATEELQTTEPLSADSSSAAMRGWLIVAFVAAMAGSFTVQGSITQVVAYDIGKDAEGGSVSFAEHLRVGVPVTILTIAAGLPLLLAEEQV